MILFVPNTAIQRDGSKHYMPRPDYEFLNNLSQKGFSFEVFGFEVIRTDPFVDSALEDVPRLRVRSLGMRSAKSSQFRKLSSYLRSVIASVAVLLKQKSFVYIYYPSPISIIVAVLCAILGRQYGLYVRGVWKREGVLGIISNYIFKKASFIFTTGIGFSEKINPYNKKVEPVYPMTTFDVEAASVSRPTNNASFSNALFVGHIRKKKGALDAVASLAIANKDGVNVHLKIIGGGDPEDISDLNDLVYELGLAGQVEYVGHISDADVLAQYFRDADVFLYPSYYPEGFPRVVYEAMIFGLPTICTILPGMKGFVVDRVNCLEVPSESPESIAKALALLKADPELRKRIGSAAEKHIKEYFAGFEFKGHASQFYENINQGARK